VMHAGYPRTNLGSGSNAGSRPLGCAMMLARAALASIPQVIRFFPGAVLMVRSPRVQSPRSPRRRPSAIYFKMMLKVNNSWSG
jgi:hypothetical protein